MPNQRIIYSVKSLGIAQQSTLSFVFARGVQSCGMSSNITLDQVFQLSQLAIYENKENLPQVTFTIQKQLDGNPLLWHLATAGASDASITARSKQKCNVVMGIYSDQQSAASGQPLTEVYCSGLFANSVGYTFSVNDQFSEDLSLGGNDKIWRDTNASGLLALASGTFTNADVPYSLYGSGGVNYRPDFVWLGTGPLTTRDTNGMVQTGSTPATQQTILPPDVDGISSSGLNNTLSDGSLGAHVQSIGITVDLNRTDLLELGRKGPYFRAPNFPIQVSTAITSIPTKWDNVSLSQVGVLGNGNNLPARTIKIKTREGTFIDLGLQNKLTSVTLDGADTGGGNDNATYNYITFNDFTVTHPQDVTTSLRQG